MIHVQPVQQCDQLTPPHLDKREQRQAAAARPVGPLVIHKIVREQGEAETAAGLAGAVRGRTLKTTHSDKSTPSPLDRVNRQFRAPAPNALWLADFTYVATWQGFVYVAFVIDAFARRIVGWRVSRSARADFVLDALEQALCDRRPVRQGGLVHHSDRGVQGGFK